MVKRSSEDIYTDYYLRQAGSGFGSIYSGPIYQKGHGIGSFLGGLFRSLLPLIRNGSSAVGKELLKTGANIISDITQNQDPKQSINRRGKESINNLGKMFGDHMFGSGYKTGIKCKRTQSHSNTTAAKKKKTTKGVKNTNSKTSIKTSKKKPRKSTKRSKSEIFEDIFV